MKKLIHILKSGAVLGVTALMSACHLTTGIEPCITEAVLNFEYKFTSSNPDESEGLADLVDVIQLYIFDKNNGNILKTIASVRKSDILSGSLPIEILSGDYTMVAWGLGSADNNGGFANVQMIDPATNQYTQVIEGVTTLADFRTLVLNPENPSFSDLYYAIAENVHVPIPTQGTTTINTHFQFTPYHNTIVLTINGMDDVNEHIAAMRGYTRSSDAAGSKTRAINGFPLDIYLTGKNGIFTYDGSIDNNAVELTYTGTPIQTDETTAIVEIKTLRVDVNRHAVDPMVLHVHPTDAVTDAEMHSILKDLDLLTLIQQVEDENGQPLLSTQDQIDKAKVIPIDITVQRNQVDPNDPDPDPETGFKLVVTITVAGWVIDDESFLDPIVN